MKKSGLVRNLQWVYRPKQFPNKPSPRVMRDVPADAGYHRFL